MESNNGRHRNNLFHFYAIGISLQRHVERLRQLDLQDDEDYRDILQQVMSPRTAQQTYLIARRLTHLFGDCPQVIPDLENLLTIRRLEWMDNNDVLLLKCHLDRLVETRQQPQPFQ